MAEPPSYHDLHVTTAQIPRTRLFDLPYGLEVRCTRTGGWQLWDMNQMAYVPGFPPSQGVLAAGEFEGTGGWLVLDVAGHVIIDSRRDGS